MNCVMLCVSIPPSAPGVPQSLNASFVTVTNITIQWDRVNCQQRNGDTDSYRILYYPAANSNARMAQTIQGIEESNRIFSVTGLPPRTSYTFEVQASNTLLDVRGSPAVLTASTLAPQGKILSK